MFLGNKFEDKTVLITGHTGFKGTWLSLWLSMLGAKVYGISLDPPSEINNYDISSINSILNGDYRIDIKDSKAVSSLINDIKPDFLFHLAAQSLVPRSYLDPLDTWGTNLFGTLNVLNSLRGMKKKSVAVFITSDKVYENKEWDWGYRENDQIGGQDPYSASKGAAELALSSHLRSFFKEPESFLRIGIGRAGNVIGGGDWAANRLIPDCVEAWSNNKSVILRNPLSTRPWQHVLEPLSGYLALAASLDADPTLHGHAFNFGPGVNSDKTVSDLVIEMSKYWGKVKFEKTENLLNMHEAGLLRLNCDKALRRLQWRPALRFEDTVKKTADWYSQYYKLCKNNMQDFSKKQIRSYIEHASKEKILWALELPT